MRRIILLICTLSFLTMYYSCSKDSTSSCTTTTVSYASFVAPLMASKCNTPGCHTVATKAGGHELTTYAGVKEAVDENHFYQSMANGSMPKGGSKLPDSTLNKIKSWVDACAPNN